MLTKAFLALIGCLYLALAIWCSIDPVTTSQKVGFEVRPGSGQSEYLVIYGGLEFGLALLFLLPLLFTKYSHAALLASIVIHACLVLFRTISLFAFSNFEPITYNLAAGEWLILLLGIICWFLASKPESDSKH